MSDPAEILDGWPTWMWEGVGLMDADPRRATEQLVYQVLRADWGPDAVRVRPNDVRPGEITEPSDWVQGILAARMVGDAVESLMRQWAEKARGAGYSWAQIAAALPLAERVTDRAAAAFRFTATPSSSRGDGVSRTSWRCRSCRHWILDDGPTGAGPAVEETGHAAWCARHAADVAAWLGQAEGADPQVDTERAPSDGFPAPRRPPEGSPGVSTAGGAAGCQGSGMR